MGYCCVLNCHNSSAKGFLMKKIPCDPKRRELWLRNIGRKNWIPKDLTYICEAHFEPHMWEKPRVDGKRILKISAVPTIFSNNRSEKSKKQVKIAVKNEMPDEEINPKQIKEEPENCSSNDNDIQKHFNEMPFTPSASMNTDISLQADITTALQTQTVVPFTLTTTTDLIETKSLSGNTDGQLKVLKKRIRLLENQVKIYKKKLLASERRHRDNNNIKAKNDYKEILESMFNDDQIRYLRAKHYKRIRIKYWSNETIEQALQLKLICGTNGYEELMKLKYPLPSLRTLRARTEKMKEDETGISIKNESITHMDHCYEGVTLLDHNYACKLIR